MMGYFINIKICISYQLSSHLKEWLGFDRNLTLASRRFHPLGQEVAVMFEIFKNILTLMSCTFHITSDIFESLAFRRIGGLVIEKRIQRD